MSRSLAIAIAAMALLSTAHAAAPDSVLELVQLCAEATPFPSAVDAHARRERWWRLDDDTLSTMRASTDMAAQAERGWLDTQDEIILTFATENDRLAALGEPLHGEARLPVVACTVYGTRTEVEQIRLGLEHVTMFGRVLGPPTSELPIENNIGARQWVVRSGAGEVAYVFARFAGNTAIVEVGRVSNAPQGGRP